MPASDTQAHSATDEYVKYFDEKWETLEQSVDSLRALLGHLNDTLGSFMDRRVSTPYSYPDMEKATQALSQGADYLDQIYQWRSTHTPETIMTNADQGMNGIQLLENVTYQAYNVLVPPLRELSQKKSEFGGYLRAKVETLSHEFSNLFDGVKGVLKALVALNEDVLVDYGQEQGQEQAKTQIQQETSPIDEHAGQNVSTIPSEQQIGQSFEESGLWKYQCPHCDAPEFDNYIQLKQHMRTEHPEKVPLMREEGFFQGPQKVSCPYCDWRGGYDYELGEHLQSRIGDKVHPETLESYDKGQFYSDPYSMREERKCPDCGESLYFEPNEKEWRCSNCGYIKERREEGIDHATKSSRYFDEAGIEYSDCAKCGDMTAHLNGECVRCAAREMGIDVDTKEEATNSNFLDYTGLNQKLDSIEDYVLELYKVVGENPIQGEFTIIDHALKAINEKDIDRIVQSGYDLIEYEHHVRPDYDLSGLETVLDVLKRLPLSAGALDDYSQYAEEARGIRNISPEERMAKLESDIKSYESLLNYADAKQDVFLISYYESKLEELMAEQAKLLDESNEGYFEEIHMPRIPRTPEPLRRRYRIVRSPRGGGGE